MHNSVVHHSLACCTNRSLTISDRVAVAVYASLFVRHNWFASMAFVTFVTLASTMHCTNNANCRRILLFVDDAVPCRTSIRDDTNDSQTLWIPLACHVVARARIYTDDHRPDLDWFVYRRRLGMQCSYFPVAFVTVAALCVPIESNYGYRKYFPNVVGHSNDFADSGFAFAFDSYASCVSSGLVLMVLVGVLLDHD